jgi:RHS repeat-associated protein
MLCLSGLMTDASALHDDPESVANLYRAARRKPTLCLVGSAETATIHSVFGPDGNRIAEYDEATGALLRQYVWIGLRPIAVLEGTARTRFLTRVDYIGRPIYATNTSGVKQWTAKYLPFGGVQTTTGSPIALRFPGQWFQAETGLHQNWMRDYDPTTGRYIQADPLGLVDGASVYGYALGNPGRYTDPTGLSVSPLPTVPPLPGIDDGIICVGEMIGTCVLRARFYVKSEHIWEFARTICQYVCTNPDGSERIVEVIKMGNRSCPYLRRDRGEEGEVTEFFPPGVGAGIGLGLGLGLGLGRRPGGSGGSPVRPDRPMLN